MSARSAGLATRIVRSGMADTVPATMPERTSPARENDRAAPGLSVVGLPAERLLLLDDAARNPSAAVAGGIGLEIVLFHVDDDGVADDVILAAVANGQAHDGLVEIGFAVGAGLDVAEVA